MKIVVKALLKSPDEKFLLLRRSETHPYWPHHLDLPGGEVESGEDSLVAVVREITEETGAIVRAEEIVLAFDRIVDNQYQHILYSGTIPQNTPITLSWEHDQYIWLTLSEMLQQTNTDNVDSYYKAVIDWLSSDQKL